MDLQMILGVSGIIVCALMIFVLGIQVGLIWCIEKTKDDINYSRGKIDGLNEASVVLCESKVDYLSNVVLGKDREKDA